MAIEHEFITEEQFISKQFDFEDISEMDFKDLVKSILQKQANNLYRLLKEIPENDNQKNAFDSEAWRLWRKYQQNFQTNIFTDKKEFFNDGIKLFKQSFFKEFLIFSSQNIID